MNDFEKKNFMQKILNPENKIKLLSCYQCFSFYYIFRLLKQTSVAILFFIFLMLNSKVISYLFWIKFFINMVFKTDQQSNQLIMM